MTNPQNLPIKKRLNLKAEHILMFFIGTDEKLDDLIIFHPDIYDLTTTDLALYQALGSIKEYDNFQRAKLVKFLEAVSVTTLPKTVLTHDRVEFLRKLALQKINNQKEQR